MTSKIRSIAIDFGNTNTLVALALDDGSKQLLHLPEIAQLDAQLTTDPEHPYSYIPSEIFHSEWGPEIGCRAWAKIQQDDTPQAFKRYGRNFKRALLQSFICFSTPLASGTCPS